MSELKEIFTQDMRLWGFQFCTNSQKTIITRFGLRIGLDFERGNFFDMTPLGPGLENCTQWQLSDPVLDPVSRLELFIVSDFIMGV